MRPPRRRQINTSPAGRAANAVTNAAPSATAPTDPTQVAGVSNWASLPQAVARSSQINTLPTGTDNGERIRSAIGHQLVSGGNSRRDEPLPRTTRGARGRSADPDHQRNAQ